MSRAEIHKLLPFEAEAVADMEGLQSVYFVQATLGGPIKIGKSLDPQKRVTGMQTGSPVPLRLLAQIVEAAEDLEETLHADFAHLRLHGEWFRPGDELLRFIGRLGGKAIPEVAG